MPAYARWATVATDEVGVYHCWNRCVRKAFLCGRDDAAGKDFGHRKAWVRQRLEELAGIAAVEVAGYAVMDNHLHVVLRARPDVAATWSVEDVARRALLLTARPGRDGRLKEPTQSKIEAVLAVPRRLAEMRRRLADVSWFMRCLSEPIARRANREDQVRGRFWEDRFSCRRLLDDAAVLTAMMYVDLNPIRAAITRTPEESTYTSAFDRIRARRQQSRPGAADKPAAAFADGWIAPLSPAETAHADDKKNATTAKAGGVKSPPGKPTPPVALGEHRRRASEEPILPIDRDEYLTLLDWTGRQVRVDKRGAIPAELRPIPDRLEIRPDRWLDTVSNVGGWFRRMLGRAEHMSAHARSLGRHWFQGVRACRRAFK